MDNWSVIKCFEKGFECFYQSLAEKGVISVNKNSKNNKSEKKRHPDRHHSGAKDKANVPHPNKQLNMQNYQEKVKN